MKAAHGLAKASIPTRRIARSLMRLRAQLPRELPLAGIRIAALGDQVVVSEGAQQWQADNGQFLLSFEVEAPRGEVKFIDVPHSDVSAEARANNGAESGAKSRTENEIDDYALFAEAFQLEEEDARYAEALYARAIVVNPSLAVAYVNLGRLLHERGAVTEAERLYRRALVECPNESLLHFNYGVMLEDSGHTEDAIAAYRRALTLDEGLADAHYNLALLLERNGDERSALRHFAHYRRLQAKH